MKQRLLQAIIFCSLITASFSLKTNAQIIQSSCQLQDSMYFQEISRFAKEIALFHMKQEGHIYHDSILIPVPFIDSICNYLTTFTNAISLSNSIIDFTDFYFFQSERGYLNISLDSSCINTATNAISDPEFPNKIDSLSLHFKNNEI